MSRHSKQHDLSKDKAGSASASTKSMNNDTKTFVERLGASAATLTRQALLQPSGAAIAQTMGSLSMNTEKGESSSSSAASEELFSNTDTLSSRPSSMASDAKKIATSSRTDTFQERTETNESDLSDSAPFDLDAFLSEPDRPKLEVSSSTGFDEGPLALKRKECDGNIRKGSPQSSNAHQGFESYRRPSHDNTICSFASQSYLGSAQSAHHKDLRNMIDSTDGAAVVDLLSKPGLLIDDDIEDHVPTLARSSDIYRQSKYSETGPTGISADRNGTQIERRLIPNLGLTRIDLKTIAQAMPRAADEAHKAELQPWLEILNSYQDEVWGDILPLVRQAREELAITSDDENARVDKSAVMRLRMILSHLAPPQNT